MDMKKIKVFFVLPFAASLVLACTREAMVPFEENESPVVSENQVLVPFTAEAGSPQTKVEMKDGNTANIVFSEGDKLMVYHYSVVDPSILTLKSGAGNKSAKFEGDLVLKPGKTEADLAGKMLCAILIPAEGAAQGVFKYDAAAKKLTVDYRTKSVDMDIEALVKRCILYTGDTKYEDRKFSFEMLTSFVKMNVTVPSEESDLARDYTVTVTNAPQITAMISHEGRLSWDTDYYPTQSGTFKASSGNTGTLYMAVLTRDDVRYYVVDSEYDDKLTFSVSMNNDYKGYRLTGGSFTDILIHGKGYTKAVKLRDDSYDDVLKGQPASVRKAIGGDINGNGYLSGYEAAQKKVFNLSSAAKDDLTDASFLRYFTGLEKVIYQTFSNCTKLTTVRLPKYIRSIDQQAFYNCSKLSSIIIVPGVESIGQDAFNGCAALPDITIPSSVTEIGSYAFKACSSLTKVTFATPCNVTFIDTGAFSGCSSLEYFSIPSGVTTIWPETFYGCESLAGVSIPSGVDAIGGRAFVQCNALESISIPSSVRSIWCNTFNDCAALKYFTCNPATPPSIGGNSALFYKCPNLTKIYVPSASLGKYLNADGWKDYTYKYGVIK